MLIIRKTRHGDIPALEVLFKVTQQKTFILRPSDQFQIGDYQKSTAADDVYVAEENGLILGFVSIYLAKNFIHNLFVHPDYQKRGIGSKLLQTAEINLAHPMTLKIAMDNLKACSFYEKHGWHQVSAHKHEKQPYVLYGKE